METLNQIFGNSEQLTTVQMGARGVVTFILTLALIRLAGRRSFGLRTPLDNIIMILLGAVLGRGVVGASPFVPVIVTCFIIAGMHRLFAWSIVKFPKMGSLLEGDKILIYQNDKFLQKNMQAKDMSKEDVMQGVRKAALTENLENIERIYIEKNGEIGAVKKT